MFYNLKLNISIGIMTLILMSNPCKTVSLIDADYDQIRENGGFKSRYLEQVSVVRSSKEKLSNDEKNDLIASNFLNNIRTLDLSNQDIDDDFIKTLCKNKSLFRLFNVDLSGNMKVTNKSIGSILESNTLGSVKDLPQISGRYEMPATTIYLSINGSGIKKKQITRENDHRMNFTIYYIHPVLQYETDTPSHSAVKFIQISR